MLRPDMSILSVLLLTSTLLAEMTPLTFDFASDAILYNEIQRTKYNSNDFPTFLVRFSTEIGNMQE